MARHPDTAQAALDVLATMSVFTTTNARAVPDPEVPYCWLVVDLPEPVHQAPSLRR